MTNRDIYQQNVEAIYDKRQQLKELNNWLIKLGVKRTTAEMCGEDKQIIKKLETNYQEVEQTCEEIEREIKQMERDFVIWRQNASY